MKDQQQNILVAIIIGLILLGSVLIVNRNRKQTNQSLNTQSEGNIQVTAPAGTMDEDTGEVDQAAFEANQKLSDDNSLDTLEAELNNTVILEEDFSDL